MEMKMDKAQNLSSECNRHFTENMQSSRTLISSPCTLMNSSIENNSERQETLLSHRSVNPRLITKTNAPEVNDNQNKIENCQMGVWIVPISENANNQNDKLSIKEEPPDDSEMSNSVVIADETCVSTNNKSFENSKDNCKILLNTSCLTSNLPGVVNVTQNFNSLKISNVGNNGGNKEIQFLATSNKSLISSSIPTKSDGRLMNNNNPSLISCISTTIVNKSHNYSEAAKECYFDFNQKEDFKEAEMNRNKSIDFNGEFCKTLSSSWNNSTGNYIVSQPISLSTNLVFHDRSPENPTSERNCMSSGITRRSFKNRWLNGPFSMVEVSECLAYIKSKCNFSDVNKEFYSSKRKIVQQEEKCTYMTKQTLVNRIVVKSENFTDAKPKVLDALFVSPRENAIDIDKIALTNSIQESSKNSSDSNISSEKNYTNSSSDIKSIERITSDLTPVIFPNFTSPENISANHASLSEVHTDEEFFDNLRGILNSIKPAKETKSLVSPQNSFKKLICGRAASISDSLSSDDFSKMESSERYMQSNSNTNNDHDKIKLSKDLNIPSILHTRKQFLKSNVQNCQAANSMNINFRHPNMLSSSSHHSDSNLFLGSSESRKRDYPDVTEEIVFKKMKTENFENDRNAIIQTVSNKEVQDSQAIVDKESLKFLYISSQDLEKSQILSPKATTIAEDVNDNIVFLCSVDRGRNKFTNLHSNLPSSCNTSSAFVESVLSAIDEKEKSESCNFSIKPFSISSSAKRKLTLEKSTNPLPKNNENQVSPPQKYFLTESTNTLPDPCLKQNADRAPYIGKTASTSIEQFALPASSILIPHTSVAETSVLQNNFYTSVSETEATVQPPLSFSCTMSCILPVSDASSQDLTDSSDEIICLDTFPNRRGNAELTKKLYKNLGTKFVPTNEVLYLVLEWNVSWLQIQKTTKLCPPICDKYKEVKDSYESVKEYYNAYFPIYLLSIWLKIYDSWEKCHNTTHYKVRFENCEEKLNYVKITCSSTLTNADFSNFPTDEGIILIKVTKSDGKEDKLFGYIYSLTEQPSTLQCSEISPNKSTFKEISISFYAAEKLNIATKEYFTIQKLCNVRVSLKQNDALMSLKTSEMKDLVLRPRYRKSEIDIFTWPPAQETKINSSINKIVDCIMSSTKKITLIDIQSKSHGNVIVELVRKLNHRQCTVLICLRDVDVFTRLATLLANQFCKLVIAVKASEIKLSDNLKKYTLRELTEAKIRDKCPPEKASYEVLKNCGIILTVLSCIYFFDVGTAFPASNLTCIIDQAHLFPETETMLPLTYNLKNLVLMGDSKKHAELHPLLQKYGYNRSFYNRLYKVKTN